VNEKKDASLVPSKPLGLDTSSVQTFKFGLCTKLKLWYSNLS